MRVHLISYWNSNIFCHGPKKFWYPSNLWKSFYPWRVNTWLQLALRIIFALLILTNQTKQKNVVPGWKQRDAAVLQIETPSVLLMTQNVEALDLMSQTLKGTTDRCYFNKTYCLQNGGNRIYFLHMGQLYLGQDPFSVTLETIRFENTWSWSYKSFEVKMI